MMLVSNQRTADAPTNYETSIPSDLVRVMCNSKAARLQEVLAMLRRRGTLKSYNAIRMMDVPSAHRGYLVASAWRAKAMLDRQVAKSRSDPVWAYLQPMLRSYRKNAERKGVSFLLEPAHLVALYKRSNGTCEVTGIRFSMERHGTARAPFSPSIDRIDCRAGYSYGNVRLVCQIANLAMNVWGDGILTDFIRRAKIR